jgi:hypothetical protein
LPQTRTVHQPALHIVLLRNHLYVHAIIQIANLGDSCISMANANK